jgi:hypothetical protein
VENKGENFGLKLFIFENTKGKPLTKMIKRNEYGEYRNI